MPIPPRSRPPAPPKPGLHPRNVHRAGYDLDRLVALCPDLGPFVFVNEHWRRTMDFADPRAVRALNRALLREGYGILHWDLPDAFLCPPVPGRADHLHHLADLLVPKGPVPAGLRILDLGVGANVIHPLLGARAYGWTFVGTDIDPKALKVARAIVQANGLDKAIDLRLQARSEGIFQGVVRPGEHFALSMCNPPFHASMQEAREGTQRKWRNLGRGEAQRTSTLNFGGQGAELWCPGGEVGFLRRMIQESADQPQLCAWFSSLVARSEHLPPLKRALAQTGALEVKVIPMAQGQKQSRILAWSYLDAEARLGRMG